MNLSRSVSKMDIEIQVAVQFIISFISGKFSEDKMSKFAAQLKKLLVEKFEGHWYPGKPSKGSAYRCLSVEDQLDTLLIETANFSKLSSTFLSSCLPKKLDLWIDPTEVSYRIGEHGSVIVIYKEGDDCVNSTSEYLAKVLKQLPTITPKETVNVTVPPSKQYPSHTLSHGTPLIKFHQLNVNNAMAARRMNNNHLSASAKSFVSRGNHLNIPFLSNRNVPHSINPLLNLEYLQKLQQWPLLAAGAYDPLAAQLIQNYVIMQELQKIESRRLALQSHYVKMQNMRWPKKSHHHNTHKQHNHTSTSASGTNGLQMSA